MKNPREKTLAARRLLAWLFVAFMQIPLADASDAILLSPLANTTALTHQLEQAQDAQDQAEEAFATASENYAAAKNQYDKVVAMHHNDFMEMIHLISLLNLRKTEMEDTFSKLNDAQNAMAKIQDEILKAHDGLPGPANPESTHQLAPLNSEKSVEVKNTLEKLLPSIAMASFGDDSQAAMLERQTAAKSLVLETADATAQAESSDATSQTNAI